MLAAATGTLREAVAARRPDIPVGLETAASVAVLDEADEPWDAKGVAALLRELDEARFGAGDADDVIDLYHRARREADALEEVPTA